MSFFKKLFGGNDESPKQEKQPPQAAEQQPVVAQQIISQYVEMGYATPATQEEKELISVITSSIMVGTNPNSKVKVHHVSVVDEGAEVAAILASAAASKDNPDSAYRLTKITKLN